MTETNFRFFEFGEFRLDAHRRILQKNGVTIHLTPRSFDLLLVMVENSGRVLEHDELLEKVWSGTFVEQGNLKKTISALRNALGDAPDASEFITTVPRRGYRFSAPVRPFLEETLFIRETRAEITVEEEIEDLEIVPPSSPAALESKKKGHHRFRRFAFASLALFALATIVFGAWMFLRKQPQRFSVENVKTAKLITEGMSSNFVPISADGKYIAYSVVEKNNTALVIKQLATDSIRTLVPLQPNVAFWACSFSPDNEYVFYIINDFADPSKSGLYKIPFFGGVPQKIVEKASSYITFSPDGKRLAFMRVLENFHIEIVTINPDGSDERRAAVYDEGYRLWGLQWTNDGAALLCTLRKREADKTVYYVAEVSIADGRENIIMPEQTTNLICALWLPDKQSLIFSMSEPNALLRQIWQYFPATGEMRRVTNDNVSYWFLSLTRDGKTLVSVQETRPATIWTADRDFNNFRQITTGTNEFQRAFWTADGRIVYHATENRQEALWAMSADGTNKQRLTSGNDSSDLYPRMSGDGRVITFGSRRTGNSQIWRVDTDGRNLRQLTDDLKTSSTDMKLLADGQTLIHESFVSPTGWTLFKRAPGEPDKQLTNVPVQEWDVSPDERLLAYSGTDRQTQKLQIYIQNLESGEIFKTFNFRPDNVLRWTRDGQAIIFDSQREGSLTQIMLQPLDGSLPKTFDDLDSDFIHWLDWSLDGQNLLVVRGKIHSDVILIRADEER